MKTFSGIPDVDYGILQQLNDEDLVKVCALNKYSRRLCNDENFWRNRTLSRFGKYLGSLQQIFKYKDYYTTWKAYYVSIIDFLEKVYLGNELKRSIGREDLTILFDRIIENDGKLLAFYYDNKLDELKEYILKTDLLNPNDLFLTFDGIEIEIDADAEATQELLDILLSLKDRRINPSYQGNYLLNSMIDFYDNNVGWKDINDITYSMLKKILEDKRVKIDDNFLINVFFDERNTFQKNNKILRLIMEHTDTKLLYEMIKKKLNNKSTDGDTLKMLLSYLVEKDSLENVRNFLKSIPYIKLRKKLLLDEYLGEEYYITEIEKLLHTRKYSLETLIQTYETLQ